jgi:hypothetical protein
MPAYGVGSQKDKHKTTTSILNLKPRHQHRFIFCSQYVHDQLAEIRIQDFLNNLNEKFGECLLCPRTVNLPLFIMVRAFFAVYYVIQRVLHYWTSRQPRPVYSLHGSQPQPMISGFITSPLSPTEPVALGLPRRGIIGRLWLFNGDSRRRLKCKLSSRGT